MILLSLQRYFPPLQLFLHIRQVCGFDISLTFNFITHILASRCFKSWEFAWKQAFIEQLCMERLDSCAVKACAVCSGLTWAAGNFFLIVTFVWLASCPKAFITHTRPQCLHHSSSVLMFVRVRSASLTYQSDISHQQQRLFHLSVRLFDIIAAECSCCRSCTDMVCGSQSELHCTLLYGSSWGQTCLRNNLSQWLWWSLTQLPSESRGRSHSQPAEHLIHRVRAHAELVLIVCVCDFCRCTQAQSSWGPVM